MIGRHRNLKAALVAGAALSGALSHTAAAQTAPPQANATQAVQEIIVTARRRSENVQKVPLPVSVQSAQFLQQHQIADLYDLQSVTPSLEAKSSQGEVGAANFSIRGIGAVLSGIQIESSVGLVVDDVPLARAELGNFDFFDLDRVEILRGPQGMLFGKNASAGLINVVTQAPQLNQTDFIAHVEYGNMDTPSAGNTEKVDVAGNVPIGQDAALRVTGFFTHDDGFIKDVYTPQNLGMSEGGIRAKLLWEPTSNLRMLVAADYVHEDGPGESVFAQSVDDPELAAANALYGVTASAKNDLITSDEKYSNRVNVAGVSWKTDLDLGGGYTLTNITGFRQTLSHDNNDVDGTWLPMVNDVDSNDRYSQVTEELRLASPSTGRLTYQGGFFFLRLLAEGDGSIAGPGYGGFLEDLPPILGGAGLPFGTFEPVDYPALEKEYTTSLAGYFEGQFKITDSLRLTAGMRYTHDELSYTYISPPQPAGIFDPAAPTSLNPAPTNITHDDISYRFSLDYDISSKIMAYVSYAKGYKGPTFDASTSAIVNPEIPHDVELGLKSTVLDNRLRLNLALFHEDFNGFQTQAFAVIGGVPAFYALNAGNLLAEGVEAEFTAIPVTGLTLTGGVTYNYTQYQSLTNAPCYDMEPYGASGKNVCSSPISIAGTQNVSGDQLEGAPRWTETITARYEHPVWPDWKGFIQGSGYFRSSFHYSPDEDPNTRVGSTSIFGLALGVHTDDNHLSASVFVRNLTDERVPSFIVAYPASLFDAQVLQGKGDYEHQFDENSFRTIGVTLDYRM